MTAHPVPDGETSGPPTSSAAGTGTRLDPWLGAYAERTHGMRASEIRALFAVANRPEVVSLAGGMPFLDGLPLDILADLAQRRRRQRGLQALQYGSGQGDETLREQILDVMALEGIDAHPDDVVVTTGSQQALDLVTRIFIDPGDVVVAEAPSLRRRARRVPRVPGRRRARADRRPRPDPRGARGDPRRARPGRAPGQVPLHRAQLPQPRRRLPLRSSAGPRSSRSRGATASSSSRTTPTACSASTATRCPRDALARRRRRALPRLLLQDLRPRLPRRLGRRARTPCARSSCWPASPRSSARRTPRRSPSRPTWRPATGRARSSRTASCTASGATPWSPRSPSTCPRPPGTSPTAASTPGSGCPTGSTPRTCCRAPSPRASPTSPAPPSTPTARRRPHAPVVLLPDARAHPRGRPPARRRRRGRARARRAVRHHRVRPGSATSSRRRPMHV